MLDPANLVNFKGWFMIKKGGVLRAHSYYWKGFRSSSRSAWLIACANGTHIKRLRNRQRKSCGTTESSSVEKMCQCSVVGYATALLQINNTVVCEYVYIIH